MKSKSLAGALVGFAVLAAPHSASAVPATVQLRVEGPTRTLVEQSVTVDVRPFKFSDSPQTYQCDGTGANGSTTVPSPTRGGALAEASERTPFELLGSFGSFGASFTKINGEGVAFDSASGRFLAEYENGKFADFGACSDAIVTGDDVLFAYGDGSEPLLRLAGPATVKPGESATLVVTDQANGQGVAGASVAGRSTGADGRATTAGLTERGPQAFKATRAGAIRSNAVSVCVTDGADGFCGTTKAGAGAAAAAPAAPGVLAAPDKVAAFARITSVGEGRRFAKARGPRTLKGIVDADASGLKDVRLRLSRTDGRRCSRYDGTRERFVDTRRCGIKNARTFSVGADSAFSYLLPAGLGRGRYVLDAIVIDRAGNQTTTYQRGRNRVVFFVR